MPHQDFVDDRPPIILAPLGAANGGFLMRLDQALDKNGIETVEQFMRMAAAARNVTIFEAGAEFLVEAANFALACNAARSRMGAR